MFESVLADEAEKIGGQCLRRSNALEFHAGVLLGLVPVSVSFDLGAAFVVFHAGICVLYVLLARTERRQYQKMLELERDLRANGLRATHGR